MISLNRREHDERCQDCTKNPVNFVPFSLKLLNFDDNSEIQRLFEMVKIYWCCFCWYKEHSTSIHNWIHSIKSAISFPSQMLYDMAMRSRPFFSSKSQSHRDFESNSEETHHHELSVFFSSETRENTSLYAEYDWFVAFFIQNLFLLQQQWHFQCKQRNNCHNINDWNQPVTRIEQNSVLKRNDKFTLCLSD